MILISGCSLVIGVEEATEEPEGMAAEQAHRGTVGEERREGGEEGRGAHTKDGEPTDGAGSRTKDGYTINKDGLNRGT